MSGYTGVSNVRSDNLSYIDKITQTITPASVAAQSVVEQTFTVPGVQVGDFVDITPPGLTAGCTATCARVSALNTVAITFINPTAAAVVPLAGVYQIQINR